MKTSSKLLIALISAIFAVTIAMFIDVRVFGTHRSNWSGITANHEKKINLGEFKHIRFSQDNSSDRKHSISIIPSDSNFLKYSFFSDSLVFTFQHEIKGDTLVIRNIEESDFRYTYELFTNQHLESISVDGTRLRLGGLEQDSIYLKIRDGEIYSRKNREGSLIKFKTLIADQQDAKLNLYGADIDFFHINMIRSTATLEDEINILDATMKENSDLRVQNFADLRLKKDTGSRLQVY
jgi:hypothetical protein